MGGERRQREALREAQTVTMDRVMIYGKNGWIGGKLTELLEGEFLLSPPRPCPGAAPPPSDLIRCDWTGPP